MSGKSNHPESTALPDHETMSPKLAAYYLGCSVKTLANMRWRGDGPRFVKLGRIRYRMSDLKAYIEGRIRTSTSEIPPYDTDEGRHG
jgi:hypothetical protein